MKPSTRSVSGVLSCSVSYALSVGTRRAPVLLSPLLRACPQRPRSLQGGVAPLWALLLLRSQRFSLRGSPHPKQYWTGGSSAGSRWELPGLFTEVQVRKCAGKAGITCTRAGHGFAFPQPLTAWHHNGRPWGRVCHVKHVKTKKNPSDNNSLQLS